LDKKKVSLAILGIVLISAAISIYYTQINPPNKNIGYGDVTVEETRTLIESKPNLIILDVRTQGEYEDGHLEGALLIPIVELEGRLNELSKDKEILVYCRTGNRSSNAVNILEKNGFTKIYHMNNGINAWIQAGYDTV
jgi:rhodanese-related sulfurtransferase